MYKTPLLVYAVLSVPTLVAVTAVGAGEAVGADGSEDTDAVVVELALGCMAEVTGQLLHCYFLSASTTCQS